MSGLGFNTLLCIVACIGLETIEQILYRISAHPSFLATFPNQFQTILSPKKCLVLAIICHILGLTGWFWVLGVIPLGIALPLMGASYITVSFASKLLFDEEVTLHRWVGIGLILCGLTLIWEARV